MHVVPAPGRAVRDPNNFQLLPPEGREVPDNDPFWVRRVRDKDVIVDSGADQAQPEQAQPVEQHVESGHRRRSAGE